MKTFKILGIIILVMILAFFVGAFFMPKAVSFSKSEIIKAPSDSVYNMVDDFHQWYRWSPWHDTSIVYTITGEPKGKGAIIRWVEKKGQVGERSIEKSDYPAHIQVLTQYRAEHSTAVMDFYFNALDSTSTELRMEFKMSNQFGYPFGRYIAWLLQKGVDYSFPRALANMKSTLEEGK